MSGTTNEQDGAAPDPSGPPQRPIKSPPRPRSPQEPHGAPRRRRQEPVYDLLKRIRAGDVEARALPAESRRAIVDLLWTEGTTIQETAALLRVCERTVHRDRDAIREEHTLSRDPDLANRLLGEFQRAHEFHRGHLRKIARDSSAAPALRLRALRSSWRLEREYIQTLQSAGVIPLAELSVRASVEHSFEPAADLAREAEIVDSVAREALEEKDELRERARRVSAAAKRLPAWTGEQGVSDGAASGQTDESEDDEEES